MIFHHPIIVLDGADGTGKSTLANELVKYLGAHYIHLTYRFKNKMFDYHTAALYQALKWSYKKPVIIDRWWGSELVYAGVYRGGSPWPLMGRMLEKPALKHSVIYVLCIPQDRKAYLDHYNILKKKRPEMFDEGMNKVYLNYVLLWQAYFSKRLGTYLYDFMHQGCDLTEVVQNIAELALDYRAMQWEPAFDFNFMNFTGNVSQGKYLFVGDQLKPKTRREVWPFFEYGNSSLWFAEALADAKVPEYDIMCMNATLPDGSGFDSRVKEFVNYMNSDCDRNMKVISLGNVAESLLYKHKIPIHAHLSHPQYYRRFKFESGLDDVSRVMSELRGVEDA